MTENMKKYLELISNDEEAQKKLNKQAAESIQEAKEKIIADAAVKGITLTEEDFADTADTDELSEDELDAVAGGKKCYCAVGGGGESSYETQNVCGCVVGGVGRYKPDWSDVTFDRCICIVGGSGRDDY